MPASWHIVALRAQSIVARTFAWFEARQKPANALFHTCDSTSCQVYRGATGETARTNLAVSDTAGDIRTYGGQPAFTQFSASNGKYLSAGAYPYLVSKADPYDDYPPWTASIAAATLEARWPAVGDLLRLDIYQREGGAGAPFAGRVQGARLVGSAGTVDVTGDEIRFATGLRSTLFGIRQEDPHDLFGAAAYQPGAADLVTRSTTGWPLHRTWRADALGPFRVLGGGTEDAPAVVFTSPGRLDAFAVGRGGALYLNSRATASSAWTGWTSLGGSFVGRPAAISAGGYVDVFAHGADGNLWHRWRRPAGDWAPWRVLVAAPPIAPTAGLGAAATGNGFQHVFYREVDGSLGVVTRLLATDSRTVRDLGGGLIGDPTATSGSTGQVTAVLRGTNNLMYAKDLTGGTGVGPFVNLGGALAASPVAFAVPASSRVDVLVNHSDGRLYRRTRTQTSWSGWVLAG
jgi:SpoIID/LytB domain protein